MNNTTTTAAINSQFNHQLGELASHGIDATETDEGFVIRFTDHEECIAAIDKAKTAQYTRYIKNGGNPRNKRAFGTQFAAMKRAVIKAAGAQ